MGLKITENVGLKELAAYSCSKLDENNINAVLKILYPTNSLMDRLAAYYYWDDLQSLEQAIMIAKNNEVDYKEIKEWSINEGEINKFYKFIENCY